jgi:hypothetical protein
MILDDADDAKWQNQWWYWPHVKPLLQERVPMTEDGRPDLTKDELIALMLKVWTVGKED